ncbi:hypothetical protein [Nonomuraea bangladeshensis]|uniref:hypothetical protein n=1 Tax=Nonomuraea bangladeshensis TaxID=404385 RepID=UPI003C2EF823
MTTPTLDDLQPGRLVYIPAGATPATPRPLALILHDPAATTQEQPGAIWLGDIWLNGQLLRPDGSNPRVYRTTTLTATLDKLTIAPPGLRRCVATDCPNSYDAIAMYGGEPITPGWRMLQRGILGGTNLCPRHSPTVTPDGTTRVHTPAAMDRDTGTITCTCGTLLHPLMSHHHAPITRAACVLAYGAHIADMTPTESHSTTEPPLTRPQTPAREFREATRARTREDSL